MPEDWQWYPWSVQLWIIGAFILATMLTMTLAWWRWRCPLHQLRGQLDQAEAYRDLVFARQCQLIEDLTSRAQLELFDVVSMARREELERRVRRPDHL